MTAQALAVRQAEITARALLCAGFRNWLPAFDVALEALRAFQIHRLAARSHP